MTELEPTRSEELDKILGKEFPVLDKGHIRVVDYMGDDRSVVQAARVSYGKGTKSVSRDKGLIRYLMRNRHMTPFEMAELKIHVRCPMDVWRQWIRHRTANVNELSTRYSEAPEENHRTGIEGFRHQDPDNRQGSGEYFTRREGWNLQSIERKVHNESRDAYEKLLDEGVAREQARKLLTLDTYTEAYWKIDLRNLLHFLELRMDEHAQYEIRQYANTIADIVKEWVPWTWEAFELYKLNGGSVSEKEKEIIDLLLQKEEEEAIAKAKDRGLIRDEKEEEKHPHNVSEEGYYIRREGREMMSKFPDVEFPWGKLD